jgi:hypothetical protein
MFAPSWLIYLKCMMMHGLADFKDDSYVTSLKDVSQKSETPNFHSLLHKLHVKDIDVRTATYTLCYKDQPLSVTDLSFIIRIKPKSYMICTVLTQNR